MTILVRRKDPGRHVGRPTIKSLPGDLSSYKILAGGIGGDKDKFSKFLMGQDLFLVVEDSRFKALLQLG